MSIIKDEIIVLDIAGVRARVACDKHESEVALRTLGFMWEGAQMVRPIIDDKDRQNLVRELINLNALFEGGRDWSPSELGDLYRDQGNISTGYRAITWTGPDKYLIFYKIQ